MARIKEIIPLRIKAPFAVLLQQTGKLPVNMVLSHVFRAWVESTACPEETRYKAYKMVRQTTMAYLEKHYSERVGALVSDPQPGARPEEPILWVFWWQGEENAPEIVKQCINSMRDHAGKFRLQVVDHTNYMDFASVSESMETRRRNGEISLTHFSDYYRMALLEEWGGLWIDASIYVDSTMDVSLLDKPLFTIRNPGADPVNISNWDWTVGVVGGWKGNTLFSVCRQLLEDYWRTHNSPVDYFIFDYFIRLIWDNCVMIREQIGAILPNNPNFYWFQTHAEEAWDDKRPHQLDGCGTWLYKLSWKKEYALKTPDGRPTVYAHWLQETGGSR